MTDPSWSCWLAGWLAIWLAGGSVVHSLPGAHTIHYCLAGCLFGWLASWAGLRWKLFGVHVLVMCIDFSSLVILSIGHFPRKIHRLDHV